MSRYLDFKLDFVKKSQKMFFGAEDPHDNAVDDNSDDDEPLDLAEFGIDEGVVQRMASEGDGGMAG